MSELDLGLSDVTLLPELAAHRDRWPAISQRIAARPYLRADGLRTRLGPPFALSGALLEQARELVARFDAFYRTAIAAWYDAPPFAGEYLVNPVFEPGIRAARDTRTPLPLSRFDAVLGEDGVLRVIELNPVGICTSHLRAVGYLARALERAGLSDDAARLAGFDRRLMQVLVRAFHEGRPGETRAPVAGYVTPRGWMRGPFLLWRAAMRALGGELLHGRLDEVGVGPDGFTLRGQRLDVLWGDFTLYMGYQFDRYQQTTFPTKLGDYRTAPVESAQFLSRPEVLAGLGRDVVNVTPLSAYLALSKGVLGFIHRADRPCPEEHRAWLQEHVARTFLHADRRDGVLSFDEARRRRTELLLKPCQYGGSHGVQAGRELDDAAWAARLEATWQDPTWVLQELHLPTKTPAGEWLSFGLYNFGGELGIVTLRTAPSLVVSARDSLFVPVLA